MLCILTPISPYTYSGENMARGALLGAVVDAQGNGKTMKEVWGGGGGISRWRERRGREERRVIILIQCMDQGVCTYVLL